MFFICLFAMAAICLYIAAGLFMTREPRAYCRHCRGQIRFVAFVPTDDGQSSTPVWAHIKTGWSNCQPWRSANTVAELRK